MSDQWIESLLTDDVQQGYELAIKLSRMGVKYTQPSDAERQKMRPEYAGNASDLIASSHVIATNFQTVAAANNYWKK